MPISPGSCIGPYTVVATLGSGGMAEVYRARDSRLLRDVAVKILRRAVDEQEGTLDRLLREATLASSLNHPNIVTIYDTGIVGDDRYVVMELVDGVTVRRLATRGLPLERTVAIARQVAEALAVAHAAAVVHRDIKPDNVMVRPDGYVKLLDFGLARQHTELAALRASGHGSDPSIILGTVAYMAPEQARGEVVAPEVDIFAFGVVLYEMLTGRHPFAAASQMATLHALMLETPPSPRAIDDTVPPALDGLVMEMLEKNARLRPGAADVLLQLGLIHDAAIAATLSSITPLPRRS